MGKKIDPKMHTAEHILNQAMVRLFGCDRCFSAHIETKKSKCDYHLPRPLEQAEVSNIEDKVNEVIQADLDVSEEYVSREEVEKRLSLKRLPEGEEKEVRVVRVGDYDECACIGPHVAKTGEVGIFRIVSTGFEDGVLRIRFKLKQE